LTAFKAPKGTQDILPEEQAYWYYVKDKADQVCRTFGYRPIETPVFEATGLFSRGVGQTTDIVEKEMYTFCDRSGSSLTLRPEGTAPVCRAYIQHGMSSMPQPVRLYYLGPAFRYERPQAGRMRQHHQFGYEVIGDGSPLIDSEIIQLASYFYRLLGLGHLKLMLNSIGCRQCRPAYYRELVNYYSGEAENLCMDCRQRLDKNPLRLLDCKQEKCQPMADAAPKSVDWLCSGCRQHFEHLESYLRLQGIDYSVCHRLVRGLDYYTRTVFEFQPADTRAQSTIGGGGRYDGLIELIGGKATPAAGFATGIERIIANLKEQSVVVPGLPRPSIMVTFTGPEVIEAAVSLADRLKKSGLRLVLAGEDKSLKAQLRQANSLGIKRVVIIGTDELQAGQVTVRNLETASQHTVNIDDTGGLLQELQSAIEPAGDNNPASNMV